MVPNALFEGLDFVSSSRLQRYIFFMLLPTWLGMLAGLVGLAALINSITFLSKVINENMPVWVLVKFVAFGMPIALWLVMPLTLMLAIMIIYSRLKSDSELVVMQSLGVSQFRLGVPAAFCALIAMVAMAYLVSTLMPQVNREFRKTKHELVFALTPTAIQTGVFMSPIKGITMYVREKSAENELFGVMIYDDRNPAAIVTINADSAKIDQLNDSFNLTLNQATRTEIRDDGSAPGVLFFTRYVYEYEPENAGRSVVFVKPRELYLTELWQKYSTNEIPKRTQRYLAELIDRVLSPLLPLGYMLVGLSILLVREQGRRSGTQSSLIGLLCLTVMEVSRFSFKSVAAESMAGVPFFVVAMVLPFILAAVLQMRTLTGARQKLPSDSIEPKGPLQGSAEVTT